MTVPAPPPAPPPPKSGFVLENINKIIVTLTAVVTLMTGVLAWQNDQVKNRLSKAEGALKTLGGERTYAQDIYTRFDAIVKEKDADEQSRIARLSALLALTSLMDDSKPEARKQWALLIDGQATRYRADLEAKKTDTPLVAAQLKQYALLSEAAKTTGDASVGWTNYDFDIFWCAAIPQAKKAEAVAKGIAALKAVDSKATGRWRVKPLNAGQQANIGMRPGEQNSIRFNGADERVLAQRLAPLIQSQVREAVGMEFPLVPVGTPTKYYLSVVVCPTGG